MIRKQTTIILLIILISIVSINTIFAEGFLKRSGKNIVDGTGNSVLLRGIGLGGWLVPEGYMLQTSSFANAAWQFRQKIEALIGTQKTDEFFTLYRKNFVTRKDVQKLKEWGFNSIRLPMHFNLLTPQDQPFSYSEEGFAIIDSLLQWCKESQIYLILDLHAAPGGQSKDNIADYNPAYPPLWEDEVAKLRTIYLWKTIAARYANEQWIGGYDLINETAYDFGTAGNQPLRDLFVTITNEIRLVDQNHLIFIEGNWYATDFGLLSPAWDENMAYSFHKYWNGTDYNSIGYLNTLRNNTNCPLWLGESGENSNQWFTDCIKLMETNNIGWAWWTIKKVEGNNSLMYVNKPAEYDYLLRYWNGTATKPSVDYTVNALNKFAESLKIENCKMNDGVIDAMFRQVNSTATLPFGLNTIPGTIYASNYDYGQNGFAYKDNDYQNTGNNGVWNSGYQYRNDGVDIEKCSDSQTNGYGVGFINTGEYLTYTINIAATGVYKLTFRVAANTSAGKILMRLDGLNLGTFIDIPATGGWTSWSNVVVQDINLPVGAHTLVLNFFNGGFNLSNVKFELISVGVEDGLPVPEKFELAQNYPNPFNPETIINYSIPEQSFVALKIYDILGKEIAALINQEKQAGTYSFNFNTSSIPGGLSSGIYFYCLKAGNFNSIKKMTIVK
ncbi:MAG: cellulase family glycosylhydrolase [bacterium]